MTSILPPCRVCGEKASGFHYGVNTCEACKAFFRRSLNKYETYMCNRNETCDLPPGRRNFCAFCRFKKCVNVGMCKTAIKTGRYTHEKKASDIKELKGVKEWTAPPEGQVQRELQERLIELQEEQEMLAEAPDIICSRRNVSEMSKSMTDLPCAKRKRKQTDCESQKSLCTESQNQTLNDELSTGISNTNLVKPNKSLPLNICRTIKSEVKCSDSEYVITDANPYPTPGGSNYDFSPAPVGGFAPLTPSPYYKLCSSPPVSCSPTPGSLQREFYMSNVELVERAIKKIVDVHNATTPYTEEFLKTLPEKEQKYLREREVKKAMFGSMKPMSRDEYLSVYEATGIDVDGRKEFLEKSFPLLEVGIKRYICFVKSIPGFCDLSVDDQILLIKGTRFYCWMILSHRCFNLDLKLFCGMDGHVVSVEDLSKFGDTAGAQKMFDLQLRIKSLCLTTEEACLFAAFCIMSIEHHKLERADVAEKSQELLLKCLLYLFDKYHPEDKMRLTKFIDCFLHMQCCCTIHNEAEEKFANEWGSFIEFPPIVYEIWSS